MKWKATFATLLLALSACAQSSGIPVHFEQEPGEALVLEAEEILGFELVETETSHGSVVIRFKPEPDGGLFGRFEGAEGCSSSLWSVENPRVLAHEVGHSMGLGHEDDEANVMSESWDGRKLEIWQAERMEHIAGEFWKCH